MMHFIKNLVLLPLRLAWDIFLFLFVILLAINVFSWVCATGIGVAILFLLLLSEPAMLLLPLGPLVFLKNPWPKRQPKSDRPKNKRTTSSKRIRSAKKSPTVPPSASRYAFPVAALEFTL